MEKQIKRALGNTERIQTKITVFLKTKIEEYIKQEGKEIDGYKMSDFLREAIDLRLAINTREFQEIKSKSGTVFTITIPKSIIKFKGWEKGDTVEFVESNGKICLDNLSKR